MAVVLLRFPKPLPQSLPRAGWRLLAHLPNSPERTALRLTGVSLLFSPLVTGGRLPFVLLQRSGSRIATAADMKLLQRSTLAQIETSSVGLTEGS